MTERQLETAVTFAQPPLNDNFYNKAQKTTSFNNLQAWFIFRVKWLFRENESLKKALFKSKNKVFKERVALPLLIDTTWAILLGFWVINLRYFFKL
jgi:hypothetical protein